MEQWHWSAPFSQLTICTSRVYYSKHGCRKGLLYLPCEISQLSVLVVREVMRGCLGMRLDVCLRAVGYGKALE